MVIIVQMLVKKVVIIHLQVLELVLKEIMNMQMDVIKEKFIRMQIVELIMVNKKLLKNIICNIMVLDLDVLKGMLFRKNMDQLKWLLDVIRLFAIVIKLKLLLL